MPVQEVPLTGITRLICIRGNSYSEISTVYIYICADTLCIIPVWYVAPTIILTADIIIVVKYKYSVVCLVSL